MDVRERIARRVAMELRDNSLVNLGIGLPTAVANFVPEGLQVFFQSENGIIGFGARPPEGMEDVHLTDAGGAFVSARPGAAAFDSALSFALMRGGHLDVTVLGGFRSMPPAASPTGWFRARSFPAWAAPWTSSPAPSGSSLR